MGKNYPTRAIRIDRIAKENNSKCTMITGLIIVFLGKKLL